jgi:hypothetical protein
MSMQKDSTSVGSALPRHSEFNCKMCLSLHSTTDSSAGPAGGTQSSEVQRRRVLSYKTSLLFCQISMSS